MNFQDLPLKPTNDVGAYVDQNNEVVWQFPLSENSRYRVFRTSDGQVCVETIAATTHFRTPDCLPYQAVIIFDEICGLIQRAAE